MSNSTSSTPMVRSRRPAATIRLGRRIVEELRLQETNDTLAKWMAHYLAELIHATETETRKAAKAAAQDRCCQVVERLWARRENLPGGARPLGRIAEALAALERMSTETDEFARSARQAATEAQSPWFAFAVESYAADRKASTIAILTGLLELDFGREKRWVAEHGKTMSDEEKQMVQSLDRWLNTPYDWTTRRGSATVAGLDPAARATLVLGELRSAAEAQRRALKRLDRAVAGTGLQPRRRTVRRSDDGRAEVPGTAGKDATA